jgi:hypothetical protein
MNAPEDNPADDMPIDREEYERLFPPCPTCHGSGSILHHPPDVSFDQSFASLEDCEACGGSGNLLSGPSPERDINAMNEQLIAQLRSSPFATLEEARDFLEWFNGAKAVSDWDVYRAQSAKQLAALEEAIYERDFGPANFLSGPSPESV